MSHELLSTLVQEAFADRSLLQDRRHAEAVLDTLKLLDSGELRVAEAPPNAPTSGLPADWIVHAWVKEAILLYFGLANMKVTEAGPMEFYDKVPCKHNLASAGVRVVPPGVARYGSFLEPGAILMPGFVNIGARVGAGTMVDTWATVGSCAQIGAGVHLAGGVGIGGVLEPPSARPVVIEDGAFVGSRVIVVEGVHVGREAVLGAGVVLTSNTAILDVTGPEVIEYRGKIPARAVVIPGTRQKNFAAGSYGVPCALIIGERKESTDKKTSLNAALRDYSVAV
jgi:2,3,4,5-tetrahydropyridine-2-carboxylate N-succinyltransferase